MIFVEARGEVSDLGSTQVLKVKSAEVDIEPFEAAIGRVGWQTD